MSGIITIQTRCFQLLEKRENNIMNNNVLKVFIILIVLGLAGCRNRAEEALRGPWSIDTLYYRQLDIRNCVLINVINFNEGDCELPTTENYCEGLIEYVDNGTWQVYRTDSIPLVLKFESDNKIFSGMHRIVFKRDSKNRLLKIVVKSDSLYMVCRKGLFDFDSNRKTIDKLEQMSY
jgi:hypothetical protein